MFNTAGTSLVSSAASLIFESDGTMSETAAPAGTEPTQEQPAAVPATEEAAPATPAAAAATTTSASQAEADAYIWK